MVAVTYSYWFSYFYLLIDLSTCSIDTIGSFNLGLQRVHHMMDGIWYIKVAVVAVILIGSVIKCDVLVSFKSRRKYYELLLDFVVVLSS